MYERFQKIINEMDLKVADVAKATGIRNGVFSDWKMGRYTPKADKIKKIADFREVPILCGFPGFAFLEFISVFRIKYGILQHYAP